MVSDFGVAPVDHLLLVVAHRIASMSAALCFLKHLHRIDDVARCVSTDIVVTVPVVEHRLWLPAHRIGDGLDPRSVCKLDNINQVWIVSHTVEDCAVADG